MQPATGGYSRSWNSWKQLVIDTRFECTGPRANITTTEYVETLTKMLEIIRSMDEANES